uniref:Platelet glycoprotein 4 n=1 Tax=Scleropages formosus TaxID=113540 RepID=A0A8C9TUI9_SCLFO
MACCNTRNGLIAGAVLGALLAVLGGILIPVGDSIITSTVSKVVLENGTTAYENWISTAVPVYRQFWIFEVKNPVQVVENGSIPQVTEKGPYTYRIRYLPKENVTEHSNNTIAFLLPAGAIFEPLLSVGLEEDSVTILNLAVAVSSRSHFYTMFPERLHPILNFLIKQNNASLFQTRSVKEILWGYRDPIVNQEVGLFFPYNGTYDGYYNVFTGKDDISKVALIDRWQGEQNLSFWNDSYCDMINGTDASSFPPSLDKDKSLFFFSSDICRSVSAEFTGTVNLKGIKMYHYMLPELLLAAPSVNPDNKCYCKNMDVTRNCTLGGVLDISSCRGGMPIYISLPHFFHGSEELRDLVSGLSPSEEHHSTYLDVEPITGFTMSFAKRLQINMMYGPSKTITVLNQIKEYTLLPVVWLNETAILDDETADMFKAEVTSRIRMLEAVRITLMSIGSVLFVACAVAAFVVHRKQENGKVV